MTQPTASSVRTAKLPTAKLPTAKLPTASIAPAARAQVELLPRTPGVYRFRAETGRVLYVGRATNLRSRVGSYWGSLRDRPRLRRMMALVTSLEAVPCQSVHEAAWLERNLLERAWPAWNRVRGGLEVPVWIRIEPARGEAALGCAWCTQRRTATSDHTLAATLPVSLSPPSSGCTHSATPVSYVAVRNEKWRECAEWVGARR